MPTNHRAIIDQVYAGGAYDLSTTEGCGAFTRACAMAVHATDARFGMLKKSAGRTHVVDRFGRRHAVDAILLMETPTQGISIDIISNSATEQARPAWIVDKYQEGPQKGQLAYRYDGDDWFRPDYDGETWPIPPVTPPSPPPPPVPSIPYHQFVFTDARLIARAWLSQNPTTINQDDVEGSIQHIFEKAMEMAYRLLADLKPMRQVLEEIGVNPDDYL